MDIYLDSKSRLPISLRFDPLNDLAVDGAYNTTNQINGSASKSYFYTFHTMDISPYFSKSGRFRYTGVDTATIRLAQFRVATHTKYQNSLTFP